MVLDEPDHALLVRKVRQEMLPHALGGPVLHPVVEFLVVAEVETLLLQLPLQIPIRLGDEPELRVPALDRRDHRRPVVVVGSGACAATPRALEDGVQHEHGHVAPDAVALFGDLRDRLDHRLPEPGMKGVELEHIRPRREVRVPAAGEHLPAKLDEGPRIAASILSAPLNEVLRMIADPGIVRRHVIGNEVEDQAQSALSEHGAARRRVPSARRDVRRRRSGARSRESRHCPPAQSRGGPS